MVRASTTTWLYLLRHGATDANEQRPYVLQGRGVDLPLSVAGRQQAEAVAGFLAEMQVDAAYSSPLKRAVETARAIAVRHGLQVETRDGLAECHVGRWEGKDWGTISREFPDDYEAFMENSAEVPYLGGESYVEVLHRTQAVIDDLLARHAGRSIVVVAHNVVNRAYLAHLLEIDLRRARHLRQSNTGINVIRHKHGRAELMTLNAVFHLDGLTP